MTNDYEISRLDQPETKGDVDHQLELPVVQTDEHQSNIPPQDNNNVILTTILGIPDPDDPAPDPVQKNWKH